MKKLYLLISFILISCGTLTPVPPQFPIFNFQSPTIIKKDVAEKEGLDLTVGIFGVNNNVVFLFGSMMAYDGEYQPLQSTLLRSEDSGVHWDEIMLSVKNSSILNFSMLESGIGWVLVFNPNPPSYKYTLYQTKDEGLNWQEISVIPLSSTIFPIALQMTWIDELHGQIDILYDGGFGYLEFLTSNDGGNRWIQSGKYKPEFDGNISTLTVLDSYRALIKDNSESFNLDHSGFWKLDGRYGDPRTNVIVIKHEIFADDGSFNVQEMVLPRHFNYANGQIVAPK